jgi:CelD/BcsL family acetyltransferase involved in cellulose biosynthesis
MISVTICSPSRELAGPWQDLTARTQGNVFMNPAALCTASETGFAKIHVLLAWQETIGVLRPVGFWALQERRALPLSPAFLESLPYNYAFTSTAVIDDGCVDEVVAAMFEAIARDPRLPKVISLKSCDAQSEAYAAMLRRLERTGSQHREFVRAARPFADRGDGVKKSGSTRKKLRQDWNRLSATGVTDMINERAPEAVAAAFEVFLALEMASWKGEQGTALLCDPTDAGFVRRLIGNLAADGNASVALLRVDGIAVAAQVLLYCGVRAYTWKTAYDAAYGKFSPGALLIDKVTEQLVEHAGIADIDSCSAEGSFMAQLWTGRRIMVDALIDVRPRKSLAFAVESARLQGYEQLRAMRNRLRAMAKTAAAPVQKAS